MSDDRCLNCPRRLGNDGSAVAGPKRGKVGGILQIGMAPGKNELAEGIAFVGGSGKLCRSAYTSAGHKWSEVSAINVINCYPMGANDAITPKQLVACRWRFLRDLACWRPKVLVPLGGDALRSVCGFSGPKNGISSWRGYLVPLEECEDLPSRFVHPNRRPAFNSVQHIVPTYHPSYIMRGGLREYAWFSRDIKRAVRALRGELRIFDPPTTDAELPEIETVNVVGVDIETVGFSGKIERVGISWTPKPTDSSS